jgi:hypothetical protein
MTWINGRVGDAEKKDSDPHRLRPSVYDLTHRGSRNQLIRDNACIQVCSRASIKVQGGVLVLLDPLRPASSISRRLTRILVKANEMYTTQYEAPNHGITFSLIGDRLTSEPRSIDNESFPRKSFRSS